MLPPNDGIPPKPAPSAPGPCPIPAKTFSCATPWFQAYFVAQYQSETQTTKLSGEGPCYCAQLPNVCSPYKARFHYTTKMQIQDSLKRLGTKASPFLRCLPKEKGQRLEVPLAGQTLELMHCEHDKGVLALKKGNNTAIALQTTKHKTLALEQNETKGNRYLDPAVFAALDLTIWMTWSFSRPVPSTFS
jgi:hypothetical protein